MFYPLLEVVDAILSIELMLIAVFCGAAGVSAQFKLAGGKSIGIDGHIKRHKLKAAAVQMGLKQTWVVLIRFIWLRLAEHHQLLAIFLSAKSFSRKGLQDPVLFAAIDTLMDFRH